jgi:hypothetical protein
MANYIRGDLLLYTNKGLKRLDKISKTDLIYGYNNFRLYIDFT